MQDFFSQEYKKHTQASLAEVRTAGISVMTVLLCLGVAFYTLLHKAFGIYPTLFGVALVIGFFAQWFPRLLRPLYVSWMMFAAVLGWINTRLILGVIFFCVFTPIALFFKMIGKDPLARKFSSKESYRVPVLSKEEGSTMADPF